MPDQTKELKLRDSRTGKVRVLRYTGKEPTQDEIFAAIDHADEVDFVKAGSKELAGMTTPKAWSDAYKKDLAGSKRPGGTPSFSDVERYNKSLPQFTPSEPASGTLMPLLAASVFAPLAGGAAAGGAAEAAAVAAGRSALASRAAGIAGNVAGGMLSGGVANKAADAFAQATDPKGYEQIQRGRQGLRQSNPQAALALEMLPNLLVGKPSFAPGILNFATGATLGAGAEAMQQMREGRFDPVSGAEAALLGGVLSGKSTRLGDAIIRPAYTNGVVTGLLGEGARQRLNDQRYYNSDEYRANNATNITPAPAPKPQSARPRSQAPVKPTQRAVPLSIGGTTQWRTTTYGQRDANETTPDRNSVELRKGAWENGLDSDSFAVSPDVERQFVAQNIKPHDWVELRLANGKTITKRWDDRTSDKLTGRIDLFTPNGKNPDADVPVVGFSRFSKGKPLPLGSPAENSSAPVPSDVRQPTTEKDIIDALQNLAPTHKDPDTLRQDATESGAMPAESGVSGKPAPLVPEPSFVPTARSEPSRTVFEAAEIDRAKKEFNVAPNERVDGIAYTSDNSPVPYRWKVVDASELTASHTRDLQENPAYPQELQPRDRTNSASSRVQISKIANQMNPLRLAGSATALDGAPIVGPDNLVESGNGRTIGIQTVYSDKQFDNQRRRYEDFVRSYAQSFLGQDTSKIKQPVLVRERAGQLDMAGRASLAQRMNSASTLQRSKGESAEFDAERMAESGALQSYTLGSGLAHQDNRGFVESFFRDLPPEELTNVFDERTKTLSKDGNERILNATLASALRGVEGGSDVINQVASGSKAGIGGNLAKSLVEASPDLASLRYKQETGGLKGDYNIAAPLVAAARSLSSFATRNDARAWIEQQKTGDLLGGSLTDPEQVAVMETLAQDEYAQSAAKTTDLLRKYAELANTAGSQADLEQGAKPSKIDLFRRADAIVRKVGYSGDLFKPQGEAAPRSTATASPAPATAPKPTKPKPSSEPAKTHKKTPSGPSDSQTEKGKYAGCSVGDLLALRRRTRDAIESVRGVGKPDPSARKTLQDIQQELERRSLNQSLDEVPITRLVGGKTLGQYALESLNAIIEKTPSLKEPLEIEGAFDLLDDYHFQNLSSKESALEVRSRKNAAKEETTLFETAKSKDEIKSELEKSYIPPTAQSQIDTLVNRYVDEAKARVKVKQEFIDEFSQDYYNTLGPRDRSAEALTRIAKTKREFDNSLAPKASYIVEQSKRQNPKPIVFSKQFTPKESFLIGKMEADKYITRRLVIADKSKSEESTYIDAPPGSLGDWLYTITKPIPDSYADALSIDAFGKPVRAGGKTGNNVKPIESSGLTSDKPAVPEIPAGKAPITNDTALPVAAKMTQQALEGLTPEGIAALKAKAKSGELLRQAKERISSALDKEDC